MVPEDKIDDLVPGLHNMAARIHSLIQNAQIDQSFVIGGVACSQWKEPRQTYDLDIVVVIPADQADRLLLALDKQGFKPAKPRPKERLQKLLPVKFRDPQTTRSVDFRIASYTIDHEAFKRAKEVEIFGRKWKVAPPEELILYKLGRTNLTQFDNQDITGILQEQGDKLDWKRMEWLADTLSKEYAPDFKQRLDKAKDLAKECKPESETLQSTLDKSKTGKTKDKHNP